jgi:hypothetical protein
VMYDLYTKSSSACTEILMSSRIWSISVLNTAKSFYTLPFSFSIFSFKKLMFFYSPLNKNTKSYGKMSACSAIMLLNCDTWLFAIDTLDWVMLGFWGPWEFWTCPYEEPRPWLLLGL